MVQVISGAMPFLLLDSENIVINKLFRFPAGLTVITLTAHSPAP